MNSAALGENMEGLSGTSLATRSISMPYSGRGGRLKLSGRTAEALSRSRNGRGMNGLGSVWVADDVVDGVGVRAPVDEAEEDEKESVMT